MTFGSRPKNAIRPRMSEYRISNRASKDLAVIADYTISQFGVEQARQYKEGFKSCFSNLANHPGLGRKADDLAEGLRRFDHQSHIVFYMQENAGILIVRFYMKRCSQNVICNPLNQHHHYCFKIPYPQFRSQFDE